MQEFIFFFTLMNAYAIYILPYNLFFYVQITF